MRAMVHDSEGWTEAEGDIVIIMDSAQQIPMALARQVGEQIEFLTLQDGEPFYSTVARLLPPHMVERVRRAKVHELTKHGISR